MLVFKNVFEVILKAKNQELEGQEAIMHRILFVCTGNTCRSCMAKGLFEIIIENDQTANQFEVDSAGIHAFDGEPASQYAIEAVKEYGVDIAEHRAKRLTKEIVDTAEIILCMTENHKYQIAQMFPVTQDKSYTLLEYVNLYDQEHYNDVVDIDDPFGQQIEVYKKCAESIYSALKIVYKEIKSF